MALRVADRPSFFPRWFGRIRRRSRMRVFHRVGSTPGARRTEGKKPPVSRPYNWEQNSHVTASRSKNSCRLFPVPHDSTHRSPLVSGHRGFSRLLPRGKHRVHSTGRAARRGSSRAARGRGQVRRWHAGGGSLRIVQMDTLNRFPSTTFDNTSSARAERSTSGRVPPPGQCSPAGGNVATQVFPPTGNVSLGPPPFSIGAMLQIS